jgi:hypothetical protein
VLAGKIIPTLDTVEGRAACGSVIDEAVTHEQFHLRGSKERFGERVVVRPQVSQSRSQRLNHTAVEPPTPRNESSRAR